MGGGGGGGGGGGAVLNIELCFSYVNRVLLRQTIAPFTVNLLNTSPMLITE